jgi:hypothetical protein
LSVSWIEQKSETELRHAVDFSIQREIRRNLTATIGYVGSRGVHQPMRIDDANIVQPAATSAGYVWPSPVGNGTLVNPNYGEIRSMRWEGNPYYHALQFNVTQKLACGVQIRGSYTWGSILRLRRSIRPIGHPPSLRQSARRRPALFSGSWANRHSVVSSGRNFFRCSALN